MVHNLGYVQKFQVQAVIKTLPSMMPVKGNEWHTLDCDSLYGNPIYFLVIQLRYQIFNVKWTLCISGIIA